MAEKRKRGRSGKTMPLASLSSMILATVRASAAAEARYQKLRKDPKVSGKLLNRLAMDSLIARRLADHLMEDLGGIVPDDILRDLAHAVATTCYNSNWFRDTLR